MNCKPGDMAVVVNTRHNHELLGRVVDVVGPTCIGELFVARIFGQEVLQMDRGRFLSWVVKNGDDCWLHSDHSLRPLRDNDGEDETLTWAGKPHEVTA
jgi:hypothetical protein